MAIARQKLFTALTLFQSYDQLDLFNTAGCEFLARWVLQLQAATRRCPKSPCFDGLDSYLVHAFDETGGIITSSFSKHIASLEQGLAAVRKQRRLWLEEQEAQARRAKTKPDLNGGGKGKKGDAEAQDAQSSK